MIIVKKILNLIFYRPFIKRRLRKSGSNFRLGYSSVLLTPQSFSIGDDFFTGPFAYFSTNTETSVTIGSDVMFGPYCKIFGGNHNIGWVGGPMALAPKITAGKGVIIEDDIWIGAGTTILDGSHISEGSVIAAGSVVNAFVPPYCLVGGVPVRFIKQRFSLDELKEVLINKESKYSYQDLIIIYEKLEKALSKS